MEIRRKLTEYESTIAFVVGGGLALMLLAFLLAAARGSDASLTMLHVMLALGGAMVVLGTAVWLISARPWARYDDWSEPFYTGHDEHHAPHPVAERQTHAAEDHGAASAWAEALAVPAPVAVPAAPLASPEMATVTAAAPSAPLPTTEVVETLPPAADIMPETSRPVSVEGAPERTAQNMADEAAEPTAVTGNTEHVVTTDTAPVPEEATLPHVALLEPEEAGEAGEAIIGVATEPVKASAADDLTIIEGIGPKVAAALIGAGIDTFAKLAALSPEAVEETVRAAGVRLVSKGQYWPQQAQLAAEGRFDDLRAYQEQLKAARG